MKKSIWDNKYISIALSAAFWLLIWQAASLAVASKVILPGPASVVKCLGGLIKTGQFWKTIGNSFLNIVLGFVCAVVLGVLLSIISYFCKPLKTLISPMMRLIKAIPVASFIILILLWVSSKTLPVVISFMMVLPVIYINVLTGLESADKQLLEMAQVFNMSRGRISRYIYLPAVRPHFISACSVGLGFCWKSGIAAEVIGLTNGSIGERLYEAKLYLMTDELFAWTAVIVLLSVGFEKLVMFLIRKVLR